MGKKFVFYLKDIDKSIVLTDLNEDRSLTEVKRLLSEQLQSNFGLFTFETDNDVIVCKSSGLQAVHVSELNNKPKYQPVKEINIDSIASESFIEDTLKELDIESSDVEIIQLLETEDITQEVEKND